jgi:hypothetical protein
MLHQVLIRLASLIPLAALLPACSQGGAVLYPPLNGFRIDGGFAVPGFHFPTGMAVDTPYQVPPDGGFAPGVRARYLYVTGTSNFDLFYDRGVVLALDLDRYGPPDTGLVPPGMVADGGTWDGTPLRFPDFTDVPGAVDQDTGWVFTDSEGGQMRLATTSQNSRRLMLASRFSNVLTGIDVLADGGSLGCFGEPGHDCLNATSSPELQGTPTYHSHEILDVFGLSQPTTLIDAAGAPTGPPEVLVTHLRTIPHPTLGTNANIQNLVNISAAFVLAQSVDDMSCRSAMGIGIYPSSEIIALAYQGVLFGVYTSRADSLAPNGVSYIPIVGQPCPLGNPAVNQTGSVIYFEVPVTTIDLSAIMKGFDGRGLAVSSSGDRVYVLTRGPDALVVMALDHSTRGVLAMRPERVVGLPTGPSEILTIPRPGLTDLVVVSCPDTGLIAFYDDQVGQVTATIPGVGDLPFSLLSVPRTLGTGPGAQQLPGVRLLVGAFGSGQIAVVDLTDPSDARSARVVALLGTPEDTTPQLVSNSGTIQLPYGPTSSGTP